ncbi:MAG: hypothetical protein J6C63_04995 [Lachnospiraceae bacterium]|nr:hypothetical protein [Lachnospiraceae bacterium]
MKKEKKNLIIKSLVVTVVAVGIVSGLKVYQNHLANRLEAEIYEKDVTQENESNIKDITENENYVSLVEENYTAYEKDTFDIKKLSINGKDITLPCTAGDLKKAGLSVFEQPKENLEPHIAVSTLLTDEEFNYNVVLENTTSEAVTYDAMTVKEIKCIRDLQKYGTKSRKKLAGFTIGSSTYEEVTNTCEPFEKIGDGNDVTLRYLVQSEDGKYVVEMCFINQILEGYYIHYDTELLQADRKTDKNQ